MHRQTPSFDTRTIALLNRIATKRDNHQSSTGAGPVARRSVSGGVAASPSRRAVTPLALTGSTLKAQEFSARVAQHDRHTMLEHQHAQQQQQLRRPIDSRSGRSRARPASAGIRRHTAAERHPPDDLLTQARSSGTGSRWMSAMPSARVRRGRAVAGGSEPVRSHASVMSGAGAGASSSGHGSVESGSGGGGGWQGSGWSSNGAAIDSRIPSNRISGNSGITSGHSSQDVNRRPAESSRRHGSYASTRYAASDTNSNDAQITGSVSNKTRPHMHGADHGHGNHQSGVALPQQRQQDQQQERDCHKHQGSGRRLLSKDMMTTAPKLASASARPAKSTEAQCGGGASDDSGNDVVGGGDGIVMAPSAHDNSVLVVCRTQEAREKNAERLNLDRRSLTACPVLEGERRVRLLNFQNNRIRSISNLRNLPHLIFLDLYNNQITTLANLDAIPSLRVLMLGKNKISRIQNLDALPKLDVLDLHSNKITAIERVNSLSQLRVLNLAGNQISIVENVVGLNSLTELNVRRNRVEHVYGLNFLPSLQRVFLSNNRIGSSESIGCLFKMRYLMELALDGNPIVSAKPAEYRRMLVQRIRTLRHLDLTKVGEQERRDASLALRQENEQYEEQQRAVQQEQNRLHAIRAAEARWSDKQRLVAVSAAQAASGSTYNVEQDQQLSGAAPGRSEKQDCAANLRNGTGESTAPGLAATSAQVADVGDPSKWSTKAPYSHYGRPQSDGYSEVEVSAGVRRLCVYGEAFHSLQDTKVKETTTEVRFMFESGERIAAAVAAVSFFAGWKSLRSLVLSQISVVSLEQLAWISQLSPLIEALTITRNPITQASLLRPFIAFQTRGCSIRLLNDAPFTRAELDLGEQLFGSPCAKRIAQTASPFAHGALPSEQGERGVSGQAGQTSKVLATGDTGTGLSPSSDAGLAQRKVLASNFVDRVVRSAEYMQGRAQQLDDQWPGIIRQLVTDTVFKLNNMDEWMSTLDADAD